MFDMVILELESAILVSRIHYISSMFSVDHVFTIKFSSHLELVELCPYHVS